VDDFGVLRLLQDVRAPADHPGRDPRAEALFGMGENLPGARPVREAARQVEATTARHVELHATVDLALAVLSVASGMPAEAGETVFAVAHTAAGSRMRWRSTKSVRCDSSERTAQRPSPAQSVAVSGVV
jgi:hypothetical protein